MKHFKDLTTGHTVIMGRKTFDTLERPLPRRHNVVITRDRSYRPAGVSVVHSLSEAVQLAAGEQEVFIAGGGEIYEQAIQLADRIYLTVVHAEVEGDVRFPEIDEGEWEAVEDVSHEADEKHSTPFSFRLYRRVERRPV
jgi:dihydrofolate reductase